ncbi:cAMP-binding domain of CRP or a regulatory subunit of cAMP-dependent protein kinases [Zobellia uliginosa]|uniref:cAMP-binding domain of CRP or a regulatory subunit of cAMP-dependent protein kinases n=1 Tax=Zobellia uliginosa TaxID=143224 RepID=A0ABY1KP42_9FLAO|nr:Crp/Fnr family transcriptional regulator [Zobellia uliginosa]SIS47606.1 cAMP-binding domain of CRP or a regulatory subunit of cAMP-dependent protein kinases [Zobellia uliginosa]
MTEYLKSFKLFSDEEINEFLRLSRTRRLKKGDYYITQNEICDSLSFVKNGIFRSFYYSNKDDEITYCFTFPNNLLMAYSSFISESKSEENIQSLTDAEIISISKEDLEPLTESNRNWLSFLKIIAEKEYVELEKWIFNHQKDKAQQRYLDLINKQPEYIQEIPLHYIASYLGITQRHLSRIRANIS